MAKKNKNWDFIIPFCFTRFFFSTQAQSSFLFNDPSPKSCIRCCYSQIVYLKRSKAEIDFWINLQWFYYSIVAGTLLCIFQVFLGLQAGTTVLLYSEWKSRAIRWLSWSVLTGGLGALLCCASKEDGWIPVNKNLWYIWISEFYWPVRQYILNIE